MGANNSKLKQNTISKSNQDISSKLKQNTNSKSNQDNRNKSEEYISFQYIDRSKKNYIYLLESDHITKTVALHSKIDNFQIIKSTYERKEQLGLPSRFKFSFYDILEIPPYSVVVHESNTVREQITTHFVLPFKIIHNQLLQLIFQKNGFYTHFIFNGNMPDFRDYNQNKIHLFVKQEYILYTMLKLASLSKHFKDNCFYFKSLYFNAESNLRPENTGFYSLSSNGGIAPTIVIYGSADIDIMIKLIRLVLELFPDHEELGLMDDSNTLKLSPFNIRLNTLVSYAAGNRGTTLNALISNIESGKHNPEYRIPAWFKDMQSECTSATYNDLNRKSQLFLGIDACNSSGAPIDYDEKCNKPPTANMKYCYLTKTGNTLDPRLFVGGRLKKSRRRHRKNQSRRQKR